LKLRLVILAAMLAVAGCDGAEHEDDGRPETSREFPKAFRPVSALGSNEFSTEVQRDTVKEAQRVMDLANITPGMTVADIGAGNGYYTIRLAERVGPKGRVLAQDIDSDALHRLGLRVERERLDNVSIKQGSPDDPNLPEASFDRIFLVHMYNEVNEPYAFLWRMRPALRPDGKVIVVDTDRPTDRNGIPPALLFCEFSAVGFRLVQFIRKPQIQGYYAEFEAAGERPEPKAITPCSTANTKSG